MSDGFADLAASTMESWLARHPVWATYLGEHRFDGALEDPSPAAAAQRVDEVRAQLRQVEECSPATPDERVDAALLRTTLRAELLELTEIGEAGWDAMEHNPGPGLHALSSRPFAPAAQRFESLLERLHAVPGYLAAARERLDDVTRIHTETALLQLAGTVELIDTAVPAIAAEVGGEERAASACDAARAALGEQHDWLTAQLATASRSPRLGRDLYTRKLALTLDTDFEPDALLARAEADFDRVTAELTEVAGRATGTPSPDASTVRAALDQLAEDAPTNETILALCRDALAETTAFVRAHGLLTVYDDPVDIVEMPEIDRGIAVAYCRSPGPLEQVVLPTEFAVSPTPADWPADRVASFYREYNASMLRNLTIHEAMPGHALQIMHANRYPATTPIRAVFDSSSFIEGWAVYAEELMVERGFRSDESAAVAAQLQMSQLKTALRMILNTIMDIRFHCGDLDENAAMTLMTERAFQEQGEAAGKWRRVQLTSTQLCTYYVGYREVRDLADDARQAHPDWSDQQLHDRMLSFGSPPARHVRRLLLGPAE